MRAFCLVLVHIVQRSLNNVSYSVQRTAHSWTASVIPMVQSGLAVTYEPRATVFRLRDYGSYYSVRRYKLFYFNSNAPRYKFLTLKSTETPRKLEGR